MHTQLDNKYQIIKSTWITYLMRVQAKAKGGINASWVNKVDLK